jgi:hypothetical protein
VGAPRGAAARYDVVGPVCESSDVLGTDRDLAVAAGDLLAILSAGAYGMAMASELQHAPAPLRGDDRRRARGRSARAREASRRCSPARRRSPDAARAINRALNPRIGIDATPFVRESIQIVSLDMRGFSMELRIESLHQLHSMRIGAW